MKKSHNIPLTHRLSCMTAQVQLTIAKSLFKSCKNHSVHSNGDDHAYTGHTCNRNNDGNTFPRLFSYQKKLNVTERDDLTGQNVKETLFHVYSYPEMNSVIIFQKRQFA